MISVKNKIKKEMNSLTLVSTTFVLIFSCIIFNHATMAMVIVEEITPEFEARLVYHLNHPLVLEEHKQKIHRFLNQQRYKRCINRFRWKPICDQIATFFMWAQMLAKEILNGKMTR